MNDNSHSEGRTYEEYYLRAIEHGQENGTKGKPIGFKIVGGPTGLGKTFGIRKAVRTLREDNWSGRFAYITHRHILLEGMTSDLDSEGVPYTYLKSQLDNVTAFLESDWDQFLDSLQTRHHFFRTLSLNYDKMILLGHEILEWLKEFKSSKSPAIREAKKQMLDSRCSRFRRVIQDGLRHMEESKRKELIEGESPLWLLFPYLRFLHDPARPVLLATTKKMLSGFFDGESTLNIVSLKDCVIFFDEFEVQESEILGHMCQQTGISNNFEFVRQFCTEVGNQIARGTLPEHGSGAKEIIDQFTDDLKRHGYGDLPIFRFVMSDGEFKDRSGKQQNLLIFQSKRIIQGRPFFLAPDIDAWRVVRRKGKSLTGLLPSRRLLYAVSSATNKILEFFAQMWADGLHDQWEQWCLQCYDYRNDLVSGQYRKIIQQYGMFKRPLMLRRRGGNAKGISNTIYYKGFDTYNLVRGKNPTIAPDDVFVSQRSLQITPEYILWQMSQQNMVFGISATGDIPRYVNSFDLEWLRRYTNYIPIDDEDRQLILDMKKAKKILRQGEAGVDPYAIRLEAAKSLDREHPLNNIFMNGFLEAGFFAKSESEGIESAAIVRMDIARKFLETLRWIAAESDNQAHLVFVNSFAYILKLLQKLASGRRFGAISAIEVIKKSESEYQVSLEGEEFYIYFVSAAVAKRERRPYYVPHRGMKLVVATQYATAALGVNLNWCDEWVASEEDAKEPERKDFEGIHLLQSKHFYLSAKDSEEDRWGNRADGTKKFIWQMWKLREARMLSTAEFEQIIQNVSRYASKFNQVQYKLSIDYYLNQLALFHQTLGRIDRQRKPSNTIDIRLADTPSLPGNRINDSPMAVLSAVLAMPEVSPMIEGRASYTSDLILNVHAAIEKRSRRDLAKNMTQQQDISEIQAHCRDKISHMLNLIEQIKAGAIRGKESGAIKRIWGEMRRAMLEQDYLYKSDKLPVSGMIIDFQADFCFPTRYINGESDAPFLYVDSSLSTVFKQESIATERYALNWPYRQLAQNQQIEAHFISNGYETGHVSTVAHYVFVPHAIQAILSGAVGEAAIEALIRAEGISLDYGANNNMFHPDEIFEMFDMKVDGKPIFIDAKNFSASTIMRANLSSSDPMYDPVIEGGDFLRKALYKWQTLASHTGDDRTKFVVINVQTDDGANEYWTADLERAEGFSDCAIMLIQGAIDVTQPEKLRSEFQDWIRDVKNF